ncbi:MAG: DUF6165 family protein [Desulfobacterales bacterium]
MKIDVSLGELVDKITILAIKLEKISDPEKLANIRKEYELLHEEMAAAGITEAAPEYKGLYQVNRTLWEIEDKIRIKEAEKAFDDEFIELARSVYFNNDKRAEIKRGINLKYGSELIEEKSYAPYS